MKLFIASALFLISISSFAQTVTFKNPSTVAKPKGYSHAAEIDLGKSKMLIISGQVSLDVDGKVVGEHDFDQQTEQIFKNIQAIVEDAGGKMSDVVKISIFLRDVSNIQRFRTIRDKYVNVDNPPASTLVEVSDLFRDEFLLEVEATAVIVKK